MAGDNTLIRSIHDLTQAAWFGGALMGAVAIDEAAATMPDAQSQVRASDAAWTTWQPISTAAIGAHLVTGLGMTYANKGRLAAQSGALRTTAIRTGLTLAAVAAEGCARRLGAKISQHEPGAATDTPDTTTVGTTDTPGTTTVGADDAPDTDSGSDDRDAMRRKLKAAQWSVVGLTGAVIALGARMGEQQRPRTLVRGVAERLGLAA